MDRTGTGSNKKASQLDFLQKAAVAGKKHSAKHPISTARHRQRSGAPQVELICYQKRSERDKES